MMRLVVSVCAVAVVLDFAARPNLVQGHGPTPSTVLRQDGRKTCPILDAKLFSYDFHNCFVDRKYQDGGQDLENIVDRILEHSRFCVGNFTLKCRPDYEGFVIIMDKVITQMKDYCQIYLEFITHGRDKIKDLECMETSLTTETYRNCFKEAFQDEQYLSEKEFQKEVEKALSCTNKSHGKCSKTAKTSLNRMVRTFLGVEQPEKEDIEDPEPPMKWYDYIIQPFISAWKAIRSFFGF